MDNTAVKPYTVMTETRYELKDGTKTAWREVEKTTHNYTETQYNNMVDAAPFFRRLGGSEHLDYGYFSQGYRVFRMISKSPDRQTKVIREFAWDN
jgi:hypothetical protein